MSRSARLTSEVGALGSLTTEQCAKSQHAHPLPGSVRKGIANGVSEHSVYSNQALGPLTGPGPNCKLKLTGSAGAPRGTEP
jgi:hypothetical protein